MFNITLYRKKQPSDNTQKLSDIEAQVLNLMISGNKPTIEEICTKINRKKSSVYKILKSLKEKGYLIH
jgi:predicted transcriptional regulator